uniref:Helix-turn-helix domain-containing protein n=1 Tax=Roseihalotalea indica TaxID=2867963 RepID=A0AA49GPK0_9BACT|nr:helix-turn-helix domain-containing protein [Tunicatimonas sp. TK19036]
MNTPLSARTLHIKNMVCNRCIRVVREELEQLGFNIINIKLGEVELMEEPTAGELKTIAQTLSANGFELLDSRKSQLIEKVKNAIIELIHQSDEISIRMNYSQLIQDRVGADYHYLSTVFSTTEGMTIEKYLILQRIERTKELLLYNELSLSQIADKLGYSSVAHLSAQFKKVTGLTPSAFKKLTGEQRTSLDQV